MSYSSYFHKLYLPATVLWNFVVNRRWENTGGNQTEKRKRGLTGNFSVANKTVKSSYHSSQTIQTVTLLCSNYPWYVPKPELNLKWNIYQLSDWKKAVQPQCCSLIVAHHYCKLICPFFWMSFIYVLIWLTFFAYECLFFLYTNILSLQFKFSTYIQQYHPLINPVKLILISADGISSNEQGQPTP